jgi:hypothetical protein
VFRCLELLACVSDDPATAEVSQPHELVRDIEAGIASGTDVHDLQLELMAWVAAPEGEAPVAEGPAPEAGGSEAATHDAEADTNKPPSPVNSPANLVKEIELLRTAGALANRDALRKAQLRPVTWIPSPGGLVDVPLSLGFQAARVEDMGSRNQRTLQSWACKLFTALAQLLKAGIPAPAPAVRRVCLAGDAGPMSPSSVGTRHDGLWAFQSTCLHSGEQ